MKSSVKDLKFTLKAWPLITLITVALCFLTSWVSEFAFGIELDNQESIEQVRRMVTWLIKRLCYGAGLHWYFFKDLMSLFWMVFSLVALVPAIEEVVFRWVLFRLPEPKKPLIPAITSSVLFSAAHYLQMSWPNNAFVALFFFGMAQCWLYNKTGKLWTALLNHALFNLTNLILIFILPAA